MPGARVWHCDGATAVRSMSRGSQHKRQFLSTRNMLLLARKHVRWWQMPTYLTGFLVGHVAFFTALRIVRGDIKALRAIYRGIFAPLLDAPPTNVLEGRTPSCRVP